MNQTGKDFQEIMQKASLSSLAKISAFKLHKQTTPSRTSSQLKVKVKRSKFSQSATLKSTYLTR